MRRTTIALAALLLAGCGAEFARDVGYTVGNKPTRVPVEIREFAIQDLDVYFHKSEPDMAYVQPASGMVIRLAAGGRSDSWAAMRQEIEPMYRAALERALADSGRQCTIESATPVPNYFAFEFRYLCPTEASASAE